MRFENGGWFSTPSVRLGGNRRDTRHPPVLAPATRRRISRLPLRVHLRFTFAIGRRCRVAP